MTLLDIFSMLGGIGIFLYGMSVMSSGLRSAAGDRLRVIIERATSNRMLAVLIGIVVTIIVQSSAATTMMSIGFVSSGLMTLPQAVGIILGANIGTTVTAQITAFDLGAYAPIILFCGACMHLFSRPDKLRHIGAIVMGFGMLFVGISITKEAIVPLADSAGFASFLNDISNPAVAILFGMVFTALLQSSSSSSVIFQTFAIEGLIGLDMASYLVIGAAIGAVTPNYLAAIASPGRDGIRTAHVDLAFNLIRASMMTALVSAVPYTLEFIRWLSPNDIGRQVANAHTIFATVSVLAVLPFGDRLVKLARSLAPDKDDKGADKRHLVYLNPNDRLPPAIALHQAKLEIVRMGRIARDNLKCSLDCFFNHDHSLAAKVEYTEDTVNYLNHTITDMLVTLRSRDMSTRDLSRLAHMSLVVADIERISDHAENIVEYESQIRQNHTKLTDDAIADLHRIADASLQSIDQCLGIFENENFEELDAAEAQEQHVDNLQEELTRNHLHRLMDRNCEALAGVVFTDMTSDLERCSDHAINIAFALHEYRFAPPPEEPRHAGD